MWEGPQRPDLMNDRNKKVAAPRQLSHSRDLRRHRWTDASATFFITKSLHPKRSVLNLEARTVVVSAFRFAVEQNRIYLRAFVVMPDHWHALFALREPWAPPKFMHDLMSYVGWKDAKSALRYVDAGASFGGMAVQAPASMEQLTRIPFSELKVDRTFVANAGINEAARLVLKSSLKLARDLSIDSVAEGVETQRDWELLQELGCDLAQGYYIAQPMEAAAYLRWMRGLARDATSVFIA